MRALPLWIVSISAVALCSWWIEREPADPPAPGVGRNAATLEPASSTLRLWVCPAVDLSKPGATVLREFSQAVAPRGLWANLQPATSNTGPRWDRPLYLLWGASPAEAETPARFLAQLKQLEDCALEHPVTICRTRKDTDLHAQLEQELEFDLVAGTSAELFRQLGDRLPVRLQGQGALGGQRRVTLIGRLSARQALALANQVKPYRLLAQDDVRDLEPQRSPATCWRLYPLATLGLRETLRDVVESAQMGYALASTLLPTGVAAELTQHRWTEEVWRALSDAERFNGEPLVNLALPAAERSLSDLAREVARQTGGAMAVIFVEVEEGASSVLDPPVNTQALHGSLDDALRRILTQRGWSCACQGSLITVTRPGSMSSGRLIYVPLDYARIEPGRDHSGLPQPDQRFWFHRQSILAKTLAPFERKEDLPRVIGGQTPGVLMQVDESHDGHVQIARALTTDSPLIRFIHTLHETPRPARSAALAAALAGDDVLVNAFAAYQVDAENLVACRPHLLKLLASGRLLRAGLWRAGTRVRGLLCPRGQPTGPEPDVIQALQQMALTAPPYPVFFELAACADQGGSAVQALFSQFAVKYLAERPEQELSTHILERALRSCRHPASRDGLKMVFLTRLRDYSRLREVSPEHLLPVLLEGLRDSDPDRRLAACQMLRTLGRWSQGEDELYQQEVAALELLQQDPLMTREASEAHRVVTHRNLAR